MRLRRGADYRRAFAHGRRKANRLLTLYYVKNDQGQSRVGLVLGRRVGKAVQRNKVRRRLQEILGTLGWNKGWKGFSLVVRKEAKGASFKSWRRRWPM